MLKLSHEKWGLPLIILILFVEGFAGLSYQMIYIRQLTPVIGNNITIVSWVVGVFLLLLAIGYRQGGLYKGDIEERLTRNFMIGAFVSGVGLSTLFIMTVFQALISALGHYLFLIFYCFLIVAPTSFVLGQTIPLLTNKMPEAGVSKISGDVLFFSTIGSFLGSVVGVNLLVHYLGVAETVFIVTVSLILLACLLSKKAVVFAFIFTPFLYLSTIHYENQYYITTNEYSSYRVEENNQGRSFFVNESFSSFISKDGGEYAYIENAKNIAFDALSIENEDILTIGAGGFTFSRNIENNNFTYVDIDPEMKEVAEEHFLKESINGEFVGEDARGFLLRNEKDYGFIFLDAYVSRYSIPEHLSTVEFFDLIKNNLKDGGVFMINAITTAQFTTDFSRSFHKTITAQFPYCYTSPEVLDRGQRMNMIYVCFNYEKEQQSYTDNKNHSNTDFWNTLFQ